MLTIKNIDKIKGKYVTIKGYSFIVDNPIETTSKYTIRIIAMSTLHSPMIVTLNRDEGCNTYKLRKVGEAVYVELSIEDMENQRVFLDTLENYLNTL